MLVLGTGYHSAGNDAGVTQKGSHARTQGHGFGAKQAKQPVSRLAALSRYLKPMLRGSGVEWEASAQLVYLWRGVSGITIPHRCALRRVNDLSTCALGDLQIMPSSRLLDCLLSRRRAVPSDLYPAKLTDF